MPPEVNRYKKASQGVKTALRGVEFIAQHIKNADKDNEVKLVILLIYTCLLKETLTYKKRRDPNAFLVDGFKGRGMGLSSR